MTRDEYVEGLKKKLDEWNTTIGRAEEQMRQASGDASARYAAQLDEMKKRRADAEKQMNEALRKSSEDWNRTQRDFERAWKDIAGGFQRAWSRFK